MRIYPSDWSVNNQYLFWLWYWG